MGAPPFALEEPCPGCGERRVATMVWRSESPQTRPFPLPRMEPHFLCRDGEVVWQEVTDAGIALTGWTGILGHFEGGRLRRRDRSLSRRGGLRCGALPLSPRGRRPPSPYPSRPWKARRNPLDGLVWGGERATSAADIRKKIDTQLRGGVVKRRMGTLFSACVLASAALRAAERARRRSGRHGPVGQPLQELLPVRRRRVAQEEPDLRRTGRAGARSTSSTSATSTLRTILERLAGESPRRRRDPRSASSATSTAPAWTSRRSRRRHRADRAGAREDRRDQGRARAARGDRAPPVDGRQRRLRVRLRAGPQELDSR